MKYFILTTFILLSFCIHANDGAYYISGNQLIPVTETDISVKKEILTIKRKNAEQVDVSVYYEFYNPGKEKKLVVGFEAYSPHGDAEATPQKGRHPYLYDFTVKMNKGSLSYSVDIVNADLYYENGNFKTLNKQEIEKSLGNYDGMGADFIYVYHFDAYFRPGLNIVEHTYTCDLSASVDYTYSFDYILTAAKRWANKQIDDFTLIIDMGSRQNFNILNTPFGDNPVWRLVGDGTMSQAQYTDYFPETPEEKTRTDFMIKKGYIEYRAMNFDPQGELLIRSPRALFYIPQPFNYRETLELPYNITEVGDYTIDTADETSKKILKNLPFAMRGYIFSTPELQKYYSGQVWYKPDASYKAILSDLSKDEQEWVLRYSE